LSTALLCLSTSATSFVGMCGNGWGGAAVYGIRFWILNAVSGTGPLGVALSGGAGPVFLDVVVRSCGSCLQVGCRQLNLLSSFRFVTRFITLPTPPNETEHNKRGALGVAALKSSASKLSCLSPQPPTLPVGPTIAQNGNIHHAVWLIRSFERSKYR